MIHRKPNPSANRLLSELLGIVIGDDGDNNDNNLNDNLSAMQSNNDNEIDMNSFGSDNGNRVDQNNIVDLNSNNRFTFETKDTSHIRQSTSPGSSGKQSSSAGSMVKIIDIQRRATPYKKKKTMLTDHSFDHNIDRPDNNTISYLSDGLLFGSNRAKVSCDGDDLAPPTPTTTTTTTPEEPQTSSGGGSDDNRRASKALLQQVKQRQQQAQGKSQQPDSGSTIHSPSNQTTAATTTTATINEPSVSGHLSAYQQVARSFVDHPELDNSTNTTASPTNKLQHSNQKQQSGETLSTSFESDYDLLVYLGETETEDIVETERSLDYQDQTWRQSICGGASLAPTIDDSLSELLGVGGSNFGGNRSDFGDFDLLNSPIDPASAERSISATLRQPTEPATKIQHPAARSPRLSAAHTNEEYLQQQQPSYQQRHLQQNSPSSLMPSHFSAKATNAKTMAPSSDHPHARRYPTSQEAAELDRLLQEMSRTLDLDSLARYDSSKPAPALAKSSGQATNKPLTQQVVPNQQKQWSQVKPQPVTNPAAATATTTTAIATTTTTTSLPARTGAIRVMEAEPIESASSQWQVSKYHTSQQPGAAAMPVAAVTTAQVATVATEQRVQPKATSQDSILEEYDGASRMLEQMISDYQMDAQSMSSGSGRTKYQSAASSSQRRQPGERKSSLTGSASTSCSRSRHGKGDDSPASTTINRTRKTSTCSSSINTDASVVPNTPTAKSSRVSEKDSNRGTVVATGSKSIRVGDGKRPWQRQISNSASESVRTSPSVDLSGAGSTGSAVRVSKAADNSPTDTTYSTKVKVEVVSGDLRKGSESPSLSSSSTTNTEPPPVPEIDYIEAVAEEPQLDSLEHTGDEEHPGVIRLQPAMDSLSSDSDARNKPVTSKKLVERVDRMKRRTMQSMRSMRNRVSNFMDSSSSGVNQSQKGALPPTQQQRRLQQQQPQRQVSVETRTDLITEKPTGGKVIQSIERIEVKQDPAPSRPTISAPILIHRNESSRTALETKQPQQSAGAASERLSRSDRFRRNIPKERTPADGKDQTAAGGGGKSFGQQIRERLSRSKSRLSKFLKMPAGKHQRAQSTPDVNRADTSGNRKSVDSAAKSSGDRLFEPSDIARNSSETQAGVINNETQGTRGTIAVEFPAGSLPPVVPPKRKRSTLRALKSPTPVRSGAALSSSTSSLSSAASALASLSSSTGELSGLESSPKEKTNRKLVRRRRKKRQQAQSGGAKSEQTDAKKEQVRRSSSFTQSIRKLGDTFTHKSGKNRNTADDDQSLRPASQQKTTNRSMDDLNTTRVDKSGTGDNELSSKARTSSMDAVPRGKKRQWQPKATKKNNLHDYFARVDSLHAQRDEHRPETVQSDDGGVARATTSPDQRQPKRSQSLRSIRDIMTFGKGSRKSEKSPERRPVMFSQVAYLANESNSKSPNKRRALPMETNTFRPSSAMNQVDLKRTLDRRESSNSDVRSDNVAQRSGPVTPVSPAAQPLRPESGMSPVERLKAPEPKERPKSRLARAKSAAATLLVQNRHLVFRTKPPRGDDSSTTPVRPPRHRAHRRRISGDRLRIGGDESDDEDSDSDMIDKQRSRSAADSNNNSVRHIASASPQGGTPAPPTRRSSGPMTLASSKKRLLALAQQLQNSASDFLQGRSGSSPTVTGEAAAATQLPDKSTSARQRQQTTPTDWVEWKPVIVNTRQRPTGSSAATSRSPTPSKKSMTPLKQQQQQQRETPRLETKTEQIGRTESYTSGQSSVGDQDDKQVNDNGADGRACLAGPYPRTGFGATPSRSNGAGTHLSTLYGKQSLDEPTDTTWQSSSSSSEDLHGEAREIPRELDRESISVTRNHEQQVTVRDNNKSCDRQSDLSQSKSPVKSVATLQRGKNVPTDSDIKQSESSDASVTDGSSSFKFKFSSNIPTPAQVRRDLNEKLLRTELQKFDRCERVAHTSVVSHGPKDVSKELLKKDPADDPANKSNDKNSAAELSKIPVHLSTTKRKQDPISEDSSASEGTSAKRRSFYDNVSLERSVEPTQEPRTGDRPGKPLPIVMDSAEAERRFAGSAAVSKLLAEFERPAEAKPPAASSGRKLEKKASLSRGWTVDDDDFEVRPPTMDKSQKGLDVSKGAPTPVSDDQRNRFADKPPIAPRKPAPVRQDSSCSIGNKRAIPVAVTQQLLVTRENIIQEPGDELMAVSQVVVPNRGDSGELDRVGESRNSHKAAPALLRRESTFSFGGDDSNYNSNCNSDSDSSFASAAASRRRLLSRFERRAMVSSGAADRKSDQGQSGSAGGGDNRHQQRQADAAPVATARRRAGPVGGSLVRKMARNFDQVAAQQKDVAPTGKSPLAKAQQQPRAESLDEELSQSEATWYDAKSMEMLDEQALSDLLAEFDDDNADRERQQQQQMRQQQQQKAEQEKTSSTCLQTVNQVEPTTPSDVSQFDQFFSAVEDEQPFVSVAESTIDDDRAKRDRTDQDASYGAEMDNEDDTLNDGDEVDGDSLQQDEDAALEFGRDRSSPYECSERYRK